MTKYPYISNKEIENVAIQLLKTYNIKTGESIKPPIPVIELIEYLGYDLSFETDGIYEDPNYLGGLIIDDKKVEINENISNQEGRLHFTMAHEIGHIKLHVPIIMKQKARENILCRKDEGFEGTKKDPKEWQADTFAAYLLMPTDRVTDAFNKVSQHPITLKKKRFLNLFMKTRPARQRSLWIAENVINEGGFKNVSKLAMANRLIGLGFVRGIGYQKLLGV